MTTLDNHPDAFSNVQRISSHLFHGIRDGVRTHVDQLLRIVRERMTDFPALLTLTDTLTMDTANYMVALMNLLLVGNGYWNINRSMDKTLKPVSVPWFVKFGIANIDAAILSFSKDATLAGITVSIAAWLGFLTAVRSLLLAEDIKNIQGKLTLEMARDSLETEGSRTGITIYLLPNDKSEGLIEWSPHMETLLGYSKEEALRLSNEGKLSQTLYPNAEYRARIETLLKAIHTDGDSYTEIFYPTHKNGQLVELAYTTCAIFDRYGHIIGTRRTISPIPKQSIPAPPA